MKIEEVIDLNSERELNRRIAMLAKEQSPSSDLWKNIKPAIQNQGSTEEIKSNKSRWGAWAIAASLMISLVALAVSWSGQLILKQNLQQESIAGAPDNLVVPIQINSKPMEESIDSSRYVSSKAESDLDYQVRIMEKQYQRARLRLMRVLSHSTSVIEPELMSKINLSLTEIQNASALIKDAIKKQPFDSHLPLLLNSVYQQELGILTQMVKLEGRI